METHFNAYYYLLTWHTKTGGAVDRACAAMIYFTGEIKRIYRMPFVPIGLWFRLIARMITLFSHEGFNVSVCWRLIQKLVYFKKKYLYIKWRLITELDKTFTRLIPQRQCVSRFAFSDTRNAKLLHDWLAKSISDHLWSNSCPYIAAKIIYNHSV